MIRHAFVSAYIEAALFADTPDEATPGIELHRESRNRLQTFATNFFDMYRSQIEAYTLETDANAGHDLWYTQNGHGCGYWEENTRPDGTRCACADELDEACKRLPKFDLYEGDDELLHVSG